MIDALFHIGLHKCGSSALQTALSRNSIMPLKNSKYEKAFYISIDGNGNISYGENLRQRADMTAAKYLMFANLPNIKNWDDKQFNTVYETLKELSKNNQNLLIFSNEGLVNHANLLKEHHFFDKLQINAKAVCYVRNPVELANSAWWQWYAWSDTSLEEFVSLSALSFSRLHLELYKWQELIGKDNLTVHLLPKDIIENFAKMIGAEDSLLSDKNRNNTSLPAEILRYYQKHRELRPSMHQPGLDFILSNVFEFDSKFSQTPWVLNKQHIKKILTETKESNYKLIEMMDTLSKKKILNDPRWWDEQAFYHKNCTSAVLTDDALSCEQLDTLLLESLNNIKKLYMENMQLKKRLLNAQRKNTMNERITKKKID